MSPDALAWGGGSPRGVHPRTTYPTPGTIQAPAAPAPRGCTHLPVGLRAQSLQGTGL